MKHLYESCMICPRNCGVNRLSGVNGFCGETSSLRAASAVIHRGEEPPITGAGGSGTIFISGCNLGCSFCQNYQISHNNTAAQKPVQSLGREITSEEFALICAALCAKGAENINIVTGSHAVPAIIKGIEAAKKKNVNIPFLWNSSGYDSVNSLELLKNYIDIFLPDIKTLDCKIAEKYFNAPDYPETAKAAVLKMIDITRQKQRGSDKSKVIIRHLVLPGHLESTRSVLRWFADNAKDRALLSVMTQYTPVNCNSEQLPAA
ncbi:MAG: radical SAM protein, partial [Treponema sp.]|nr:radical SAM protein [Treponema sp.]